MDARYSRSTMGVSKSDLKAAGVAAVDAGLSVLKGIFGGVSGYHSWLIN